MNMSSEPNINSIENNFISNVTIENNDKESSNHINVRFTIALAVPAEAPSSTDSPEPTTTVTSVIKRPPESSKTHGYYRIEYSLFPGEPNIGFDIIAYRTAAKIYPDNQDSHVVLTWEDEHENVWIIWTHTHQLELNRERLLSLLSHQILVKIWDGKEYCTIRTRMDKPRIGRLIPNLISNTNEENSPQNTVQNIAQNYADKWIAKPLLYKLNRKLPIHLPPPTPFLQRKIDQTDSIRTPTPSSSKILQEKSLDNVSGENLLMDPTSGSLNPSPHPSILKTPSDENFIKPIENLPRKKVTKPNKPNEEKKEKGTAQIIIPCNLFFGGFKMITYRLDENLILPKTIQDCFVNIHIENHQLLNETLANEFNPLTITISHIENMPSTPISYFDLKQRCDPVYCCYQLFDQPMHTTEKKLQARHIYWNDFNLCLLSSIDENCLTQFRTSPILNIEVHDRDERENSRRCIGSVFGSEYTDEIIGKVSTKMNLLKPKTEPDSFPHGCVKLDLSELWLGQTAFEFYIPVIPCHPPESQQRRGTNQKTLETTRIQQGDFLSSATQMKVIVRLSKPLVSTIEHRHISTTIIAPYTRIVFVFSYDNTKFLTALETCIRTINAKALDFDKHPAHVQLAALSTYKLTEAQQTSQSLNIITGFHLFDNEQHLFVLEGRKEDAIDVLYKQLAKPERQNVEILYDSSIDFMERLYLKLGVDLTHIKLCRPLRDIVSQPLIFVRDILAKETFEALDKIHQLVHVHKLSSSARYNLFPTIEMMTSLNRDFGVPLTEKEIKLFSTDDRSPSASTVNEKQNKNYSDKQYSDNQSTQEPTPVPETTQRPEIDFVSRNIEKVRATSLKNKKHHTDDDKFVFITTGPVYPYSCQKLNASENAIEQMRTYLKQHYRSSACSFNPEHRSGTYSPYSNDESVFDYHRTLRSPLDTYSTNKDKYSEKSTPDWVKYPVHRTSRQSNTHPKTPDPARLEELSKPINEVYDHNVNNRSSSTFSRQPYRWTDRKDDFDRWTRASATTRSISTLWQSPNEKNKTTATPTVVVEDERMHFLRRSAKTEMAVDGRLSATQLDRLTGILKDKPVKKGLLLPKSYARSNGAHSAPLTRPRPLITPPPDRRIHSTTSKSSRKSFK